MDIPRSHKRKRDPSDEDIGEEELPPVHRWAAAEYDEKSRVEPPKSPSGNRYIILYKCTDANGNRKEINYQTQIPL
jgi:hypothetical protein